MADFTAAKGPAALDPPKRASRTGGYWNYLRWKEGDVKYIGFLTPASEITTIQLHEWIEVGKTQGGKPKYEFFIDRRDPCIGEDTDDLTDRLEVNSRRKTLGVAVELEPTKTKVNGRDKVNGFKVKTETYKRTNADGDEVEVEAPLVGVVNQSRGNFYRWLFSYDESHDPIEDVAFEVKRSPGTSQDTTYVQVPFSGIPIDYSNLIDNVGNISALALDDRNQIETEFNEMEDDKVKALAVGALYLDRLLDDLADGEKYEALVSQIDYLEDKFGNRKAKKESSAPVEDAPAAPVAGESKIDQMKRRYKEDK